MRRRTKLLGRKVKVPQFELKSKFDLLCVAKKYAKFFKSSI